MLVSTGTAFSNAAWLTGGSFVGLPIAADVNGDGRTDIVKIDTTPKNIRPKYVLVSGGQTGLPPDLLRTATNSLGGTTTVTYTPSSAWPAQQPAPSLPNAPLPYILQTAAAIAVNDGRGTVSTTSYAFAGGLWNWQERRFLGFASSTATLPLNAGESQPPKVETTYAQTIACAGGALTVKRKDGAGTILRQSDET